MEAGADEGGHQDEARALLHEVERCVERQRLGIEPLSLNPEGWTIADLMEWWLDTYSRHSPSHDKNAGSVRRQIVESPLGSKPLVHVRPGDVECSFSRRWRARSPQAPSTTSAIPGRRVCRRTTCRFSEERADDHIRPCPRCGFKLWPTGNVRKIRVHDLRHTYAGVLLMSGAALVSAQRLLGHPDPKITERRYGHLLPDFMAAEVNRLRFGQDRLALRPLGTSFGTAAGSRIHRGRDPSGFPRNPGLRTGGV